ncbi:MAG: antitoxin VapB family protein [Candidatus Baldrarchaeia archaeon]
MRRYKSIPVTVEAYEKLKFLKKPGESFSDLINKLRKLPEKQRRRNPIRSTSGR